MFKRFIELMHHPTGIQLPQTHVFRAVLRQHEPLIIHQVRLHNLWHALQLEAGPVYSFYLAALAGCGNVYALEGGVCVGIPQFVVFEVLSKASYRQFMLVLKQ